MSTVASVFRNPLHLSFISNVHRSDRSWSVSATVGPSGTEKPTDFEREVADRFGLVPNFFRTAREAPGLIAELWSFAKSAYLDNPMPALFKERLFVPPVSLLRCAIASFVMSILRRERAPSRRSTSGPQTLNEIVELLRGPGLPASPELDGSLSRLEASTPRRIPAPGTQTERDIFTAASVLFVEPARARSAPAQRADVGARHEERRALDCFSGIHSHGPLLDDDASGP